MAFQRPFLISLKRSDSSLKWGFGIKGGKDYGEPLTIQTVAEDSLAEKCGLREYDEVIQVGRVNVQDLSLGQVYELLARCGNKIEMFVVREDLFSPRKGKEPPYIKAVVHNPYNSPLSLYSQENIAETLAKQTEVLTEGQVSAEEDEGPENLSFKEKSAVFKFLEEQANQESPVKATRGTSNNTINKPKVAPPPPPKPKPPPEENIYNGYGTHQQYYQDQQKTSNRTEYQTTQRVVSQYQQEQPAQYQQTSVYQVSSQQRSPGFHSPSPGYHSPVNQYQQFPGYQSPSTNYQQTQHVNYQQNSYQYSPQVTHQQTQQSYYQQYQTQPKSVDQHNGYQYPTSTYQSNYQQSINQSQQTKEEKLHQSQQQINLQQRQTHQQQINQQTNQQQRQKQQPQINQQSTQQANQQQRQTQQTQVNQQSSQQLSQQTNQQQFNQTQKHQQTNHQSTEGRHSSSSAEFKIKPAPPPRNTSIKQDSDKMTAVYKQQYEQHLQQQLEQQQMYMNNIEEEEKPRAHIINGNIFEHNSTSGTPITYKAPPAAPPKPHWPPPPSQSEMWRSLEPAGIDVDSVWPPKRSTVTELPRTGFDPAAVRGSGTGRRCVWPPPSDEMRSGCNTPQSPITGRKIQWNPSPSPPTNRRNLFSPSHSPARRKDIQWPPPSPTSNHDKENLQFQSPRLSRKARFDDYVKEHASINVPQTYRPPPGTQHVEFY